MRSSFIATTGLKLARSPSARAQALRRRLTIAGVLLGLAGIGAAAGFFIAPGGSAEPAGRTGPFSYFPSE